MPTFVSHTPKTSKTAPVKRPQRIKIFLRPTEDGGTDTYYRFRLLNFTDATKNDRDYPFIVRYVHRVFGKNEEGKPIVAGEIVCPVTKFAHWEEGDPYKTCKICNYSGRQYNEYNKSGKTDMEARRKSRDFGRKYEAWVPVYVVNDPVYDGNNGKMMAFCFGDKKQFEEFLALIDETERKNPIYNGESAVDFYIKLEEKIETVNEGLPDQRTFKKVDIKKMGFTSRPYPIPEITEDMLRTFEFDEQLYVQPTPETINAFYNKFCKVQTVGDIPDDDMDMIDVPSSKQSEPAETPKPAPKKAAPPPIDEGEEDDFDLPFTQHEDKVEPEPVKTPVKKEVEQEKPEPKQIKKAADVTMDELDDLLKDSD